MLKEEGGQSKRGKDNPHVALTPPPPPLHPAPTSRTMSTSSSILVNNQLTSAVQWPLRKSPARHYVLCGFKNQGWRGCEVEISPSVQGLRVDVQLNINTKVCIPEDRLNEIWHTVVLHYWVGGWEGGWVKLITVVTVSSSLLWSTFHSVDHSRFKVPVIKQPTEGIKKQFMDVEKNEENSLLPVSVGNTLPVQKKALIWWMLWTWSVHFKPLINTAEKKEQKGEKIGEKMSNSRVWNHMTAHNGVSNSSWNPHNVCFGNTWC